MCLKIKHILFSHICFGVLCFYMLFLAVGKALWNLLYPLFYPGRNLHNQGAARNGTKHLMSGNSFIFIVTCIVGNMQSHCFSNFLFMLAHPQTRFRKNRIIWNCTFFVVLVFAKFSIKSIQQAKISAPLFLLLVFWNTFCTYIASFNAYTHQF